MKATTLSFLLAILAIAGLAYYTYFFEKEEEYRVIQYQKIEVRKYPDRIKIWQENMQTIEMTPFLPVPKQEKDDDFSKDDLAFTD